ncbi:MAG: ATP-binding protein, partial [Pseudomonadota bacterium]
GDEVTILSRVFNRMTAQVKQQRDDLIRAREDSEERRNFIETVLSGVSAGVVGLDQNGAIEMRNAAARRMIGEVAELPEEMRRIFETARGALSGAAQGQVTLERKGETREFLVRVGARSSADAALGYVMTLDDLTALVSAQREAAWGDVARRIAHEIKNPLTPIQLSAERLRRKFAKIDGVDQASVEQYTDVIVRQAGDIRRMVDEFSKFARMPSPELAPANLSALLRDAVLLQSAARPEIDYRIEGADAPVETRCDAGMITQALTNILKNAAEAIDARLETRPEDDYSGRIVARIETRGEEVRVAVCDNGVGLPANASELTEPYVTTRAKGTGLGLAIVKKIAEQHGGELTLEAAEPQADERPGARVSLVLPARKGDGGGEGAASSGKNEA